MTKIVQLTDDELSVIEEYRLSKQARKEKVAKQEACEHDWIWACSMHNDDAYDCTKCGATKFE